MKKGDLITRIQLHRIFLDPALTVDQIRQSTEGYYRKSVDELLQILKDEHKKQEKCKRCGNCCIDVGRTFWKCIGMDAKEGTVEIPAELMARIKNGDHEDGGLACEMLTFDSGLAVCVLQRDYKIKPSVCVDHNGDARCKKITRVPGELEEPIPPEIDRVKEPFFLNGKEF